ncbi:hypothetical protein ACOV11_08755 [Vibrio natriegens]
MRNGGNILDLKAALGHVKIEQTMVYARSPFVGSQFQPYQRPQSIAIKMAALLNKPRHHPSKYTLLVFKNPLAKRHYKG